MGSNEIYKCKYCEDDYHSQFECPKHHYIPMKEIVIANYFKNQTIEKVERHKIGIDRCYRDYRTLSHLKKISEGQ